MASRSKTPLLKATFKVGSIHGRTEFEFDEQVFHRDDVPLRAKEAKQTLEKVLDQYRDAAKLQQQASGKDRTPPGVRPWSTATQNIVNGIARPSWNSKQQRLEDAEFKRADSEHRLLYRRKQHFGAQVDPLLPWNSSTFIQNQYRYREHGRNSQKRRIRFVPSTYVSPVKNQAKISDLAAQHKRQFEEKKQIDVEEAEQMRNRWAKTVELHKANPENGLAARLAEQYRLDAIDQYLQCIEKQQPRILSRQPSSHERSKMKSSFVNSSIIASGTFGNNEKFHRNNLEAYTVKYHSGRFELNSNDELAWSCCGSTMKSGVGCQQRVSQEKERVIVSGCSNSSKTWNNIKKHLQHNGESRGVIRKWQHTGTFQPLPGDISSDSDNCDEHTMSTLSFAWSCCGRSARDAKGCKAITLIREDRWNIES